MRALKPIIAAASLAAVALVAAGCGSDNQPAPSIPLDSATSLVATLQEVQDNVDVGSCVVAAEKVQEFQGKLSQLPADTNRDVVDALQRGALNLGNLVDNDCQHQGSTTTTTTKSTPTEPTTTEQTTTQQTTTTAPPTTTTAPPTTPTTGGGGVGPPGI